ncbi:LOW QUALITY PROTEIN: phosphatidylinositol 3,4,5-trisphosphate 5-phosphatase 1-like [Polyodon spathula]|uniref:LOW QUALITY PROTEIN: phosphatidylinositol 3,4,5-trisphosphate 5-phosphatase 1-like n=1 Tax=Polyodon spathula TaxID=7913 RepID=UPI001B7E0ACA|nr:LOW QUALITY PROTEIN: phosphatidylinositol 3,4,5-trisphosphate 5-phosphatase 1-like [Polyodon spathula]
MPLTPALTLSLIEVLSTLLNAPDSSTDTVSDRRLLSTLLNAPDSSTDTVSDRRLLSTLLNASDSSTDTVSDRRLLSTLLNASDSSTDTVKVDSLGLAGKLQLKVDVEAGKVIVKKSKDGPEDKFYTHNKILQLIKSQKVPNKLMITVETEKEKTQKKEYIFADSKKREGFCQLFQQMKNKHSDKSVPDMITIFIGTWKLGNANPPSQINSWFLSKGQGKTREDTADYIPHDIYVIGTQEDQQGEKEWILKNTLMNITNIAFKPVRDLHLRELQIDVLDVFLMMSYRISHVCQSSVKTGIANALGNKGAVGVSFMFNGTSFAFVNSHLTSGSEKKEEDITFAPTYRYERHTHERYVYTKAKATGMKYNLPSWCDRVLWKSYPMLHIFSAGCTSDIMTSDHCPVFATFEVGVTSQFVSKNDPDNTDGPGGIKFMNCVAILKTKSKTKFFTEFHSSCLESKTIFVKSTEGKNKEHQEGSLKVRFGAPSECIQCKGCVALRCAEFCTTDFSTPLTHHGEHTGDFNGTIQLRTSEGKQREKLYDISNPNYMGVGLKAGGSPDLLPPCSWNYDQPPKQSPPGIGGNSDPPPQSPLSPKKTGQTLLSHGQTGKPGEHL